MNSFLLWNPEALGKKKNINMLFIHVTDFKHAVLLHGLACYIATYFIYPYMKPGMAGRQSSSINRNSGKNSDMDSWKGTGVSKETIRGGQSAGRVIMSQTLVLIMCVVYCRFTLT